MTLQEAARSFAPDLLPGKDKSDAIKSGKNIIHNFADGVIKIMGDMKIIADKEDIRDIALLNMSLIDYHDQLKGIDQISVLIEALQSDTDPLTPEQEEYYLGKSKI